MVNLYWMVVSVLMTAGNTVAAVKDSSSTSWLLFTVSLALTVFCVARFFVELN